MNNKLSVRLNSIEVGILKLVNGKMEFTYNDEAKEPLSLSLPLQKEPFKEKICRSYFGGLLPENPNIRDLLAKKYKIKINDDFKLLKEIGRDCAGSISFHETDEPQKETQFIKIEGKFLTNEELKSYIQELPYRPFMGKRLSLAGAQEKTAVCVIDNKIALPDENVPTTHIIKTALPKYSQSIQNEYICMKAAMKVGIDVANVEIRKINDIEFLMIERFDRIINDNASNQIYMQRILQEDFAQSLGVQSRDKYNVSFKDCLKVLNQTTTPAQSKLEFVKRVIFNFLIGNADAHAKNFSIYLYGDAAIELTPAYDLLCSSVYDCDQRIAMKIGKAKFYSEVTDDDWELFASDLDISSKLVKTELQKQKQYLPNIIKEIVTELNSEIGYKILEYVSIQTS